MIKKLFRFLKLMVLIIIIAFMVLVGLGYNYYQAAIKEKPVVETIEKIKNRGDYKELDEVSNHFLDAIVATEENDFYTRKGLDFLAIAKALVINIFSGEIVMGGSTITQQFAKNTFFTQEKSFVRKFAEIFMIYDLEGRYSKKEILELYINTIYYGDNHYGIEAASKGYFKISAKELSLAQGSMLAGLPNAPSVYQLSSGYKLAKKRQRIVLDYMVQFNYLSEKEADRAFEVYLGYED